MQAWQHASCAVRAASAIPLFHSCSDSLCFHSKPSMVVAVFYYITGLQAAETTLKCSSRASMYVRALPDTHAPTRMSAPPRNHPQDYASHHHGAYPNHHGDFSDDASATQGEHSRSPSVLAPSHRSSSRTRSHHPPPSVGGHSYMNGLSAAGSMAAPPSHRSSRHPHVQGASGPAR